MCCNISHSPAAIPVSQPASPARSARVLRAASGPRTPPGRPPRAAADMYVGVLLLCWCALAAADPSADPRGRLLRVPKVYNALITSDEPLLPSRTEQATVGQVLYYPPAHNYPASTGPLILPQVAAQSPPLYDPSQPEPQPQGQQGLVPLPPQQPQPQPDAPPLELHIQHAQQHHPPAADGDQQQSTPWPVVYASDVQQPQQQQYVVPVGGEGAAGAAGVAVEGQPPAGAAGLPLARAVQSVEHVVDAGEYRPPPAVHIDSVKNNRPTGEGIRDVPPPPLPVGRGRTHAAHLPQPVPPGILPF
ncbi:hypothetical protein ONE63_009257 [Megalurothrips usitatus]|uniref:Uncharacterized protein n=1 Tax=Megalurothrips usitatus TaxID=439358 RepID=A0AAV7XN65_9NEOP|nr:hypothetical protein ONE63_009257 [Megalurothrips usitatus]